MFLFVTIIYSFILQFCLNYKELEKHSSVKVKPNEKVYFDITSFKTGDLITIEVIMDLFGGSSSAKSKYTFHIDQVSSSNYYDIERWNTLRKVNNGNVSCDGDDCTFTWEEIKQEGNRYIYIIPLEPFSGYTFWEDTIKIRHPGGLSAGAIVGIVFGCIAFVAIIITIISCCCCRYNPRCYNCCTCCRCCNCCCCKRLPYGVGYNPGVQVQIQPPIPAPVPVAAPAYPPPMYPQPGYVQPVPYSSGAFI